MRNFPRILVTGGAGFIGSALIRYLIDHTDSHVINVDKLTYAGHLDNLSRVAENSRHLFLKGDICDPAFIRSILREYRPNAVVHLAAESHVDRSIDGPADFIQTNIVGTYTLLEASLEYWESDAKKRDGPFRFHHVSTDEVFGSLEGSGLFSEQSPYRPSSPYSATKASADHLVRAWHRTYGLPMVITNCTNNYGPYQFPEKLIPLMIFKAINGKSLPIYGQGVQIRDWLFVDDHAKALYLVLCNGKAGETYNIGGQCEMKNIDVVKKICRLLDELVPESPYNPHASLITFVPDRPGHDYRYALDTSRIKRQLGWQPIETFDSGLKKTTAWYLANRQWVETVLAASRYSDKRLGLKLLSGLAKI